MEELTKLFGAEIVRREANPIDEATNHIEAGRESDLVDRNNVLSNLAMLLIAANVTTTPYLANAVWTFDEEDVIDDLHDGSIPLSDALEKVLRYRSPVMPGKRIATGDSEIAGVNIEEGQRVVTWLSAANRDPDVFEAPDEYRPGRDHDKEPIPFGKGIHYCLGAPLANMEAEIFLTKFRECGDEVEVTADEIDLFFPYDIDGPEPPDSRVDVSGVLFGLLVRPERPFGRASMRPMPVSLVAVPVTNLQHTAVSCQGQSFW